MIESIPGILLNYVGYAIFFAVAGGLTFLSRFIMEKYGK